MNQANFIFLLIAALAFPSCRPTARQAMVDAEQPTDSTEAATSADTLRLVIIDKSISRIDSVVQARIINPNDYDVNYGQEYAIERETDGHWQQVPFPKNFGFTSVLSTVAAHDSATGTLDTKTGEVTFDSEAWYTLDGVRLSGKPSTKGIYINNGKKVVIK